jgi:hypothetical protein
LLQYVLFQLSGGFSGLALMCCMAVFFSMAVYGLDIFCIFAFHFRLKKTDRYYEEDIAFVDVCGTDAAGSRPAG